MTMHGSTYPYPLGGHPNGRYRTALAQASSSAADIADPTYVGTLASLAYTPFTRTDPLEDAGIRAGEITGYRAWILRHGLLHGVFMDDYIWQPNAVERAPKVNPYWGEGLHAFKTLKETHRQYGFYSYKDDGVVFGEVALWGEVIEHERGYRAEYASIRSLEAVWDGILTRQVWRWKFWKSSKLDLLRERYGVAQ